MRFASKLCTLFKTTANSLRGAKKLPLQGAGVDLVALFHELFFSLKWKQQWEDSLFQVYPFNSY